MYKIRTPVQLPNKNITADKSFQSIVFYGEYFSFGLIQASAIKRLYDAAKTNHPYIHYNVLLSEVGCQSMYMRDVFKSKPYWRKVIDHDGRGFYRLDELFFKKEHIQAVSQKLNQNITIDRSFQSICFYGEHFLFGVIQAKIIARLYHAGKFGHPYIFFRDLLKDSGSRSKYIRDVFKSNHHWRKIIKSDGKGFYGLHEAFFDDESLQLAA